MVHIEIQNIIGETLALELEPDAKVEDLKAAVAVDWDVPAQCQHLLLGVELLDQDVATLPIEEEILSITMFVSLDRVCQMLNRGERECVEALGLLGRLGTRGGEDAIQAIQKRLHDNRPSVRTAALDAMARVAYKGDEAAIAAVASLMEHAKIDVRHAAVSALAKVATGKGDESALAQIQMRLVHPNTDVQHTALMALGKIAQQSDRSSIDCIIGKFGSSDLHVRMRANRALAQVVQRGDDYTIGAILAKLSSCTEPDVKIALMSALSSVAQHGDGDVIAKLKHYCSESEVAAVRERAHRAINELN